MAIDITLATVKEMLTREQADILISYINAMSERTHHQNLMASMAQDGITEKELDEACRALGQIADRDCSII